MEHAPNAVSVYALIEAQRMLMESQHPFEQVVGTLWVAGTLNSPPKCFESCVRAGDHYRWLDPRRGFSAPTLTSQQHVPPKGWFLCLFPRTKKL